MVKRVQFAFCSLAMIGVLAGCWSNGLPGGWSGEATGKRLWIEPVRTATGIMGRSILVCPSGDCVIFHFPPVWTDTTDLDSFIESVPEDLAKEIEVYDDPSNPWCRAGMTEVTSNMFNCCTFAVGDVVGLSPRDWINPGPNGDTYYTAPMQVILDSYFARVKMYAIPTVDWRRLEQDVAIHPGDVVCFMKTRDRGPQLVHAGKIRRSQGKNELVSKLGVGPIVRSSLRAVAAEFADDTNEIWIYRATRN